MVLQATKRSVFPRPVRRGLGQEFSVGALNAAGTLFPSFGITAPTANVGTTVAVLSGNPTYSALPAAQSVSDVAANAIGNLSDNQKSLLVNNETMDLTGAGMDPQTAAQYAQSDVTGQLSAMNADPSQNPVTNFVNSLIPGSGSSVLLWVLIIGGFGTAAYFIIRGL